MWLSEARMTMLPPWPPSPPLGPPRGAYFSRRKLKQPLPPAPPCTKMVTRSTNIESLCRRYSSRSLRGNGNDVDPPSPLVEHDLAVDD